VKLLYSENSDDNGNNVLLVTPLSL